MSRYLVKIEFEYEVESTDATSAARIALNESPQYVNKKLLYTELLEEKNND